MSFIGAASLVAALLAGCGDNDAKPATSKAGESCARTADCSDGLICVANVCYRTAPPATGGQAGDTSTPIPVGPVLGSEGESCTSRRDCTADLGCFNNRCTATAAMGEGGATGGTGIQLGLRGESCRVNADCSKTLVCVPNPTNSTGTCDFSSFNIVPTGLTCTGECSADADCYQLPVELHTLTIKSCQDIDDAIAAAPGIDCAAPLTPDAKTLCFEQATYCGFTAKSKTWSCDTTNNTCVYDAPCVVAAGLDAPTGCPSHSRVRLLTGLTCNADSKTCVGATVVAGCTTDAKCEGKQIFDSAVADLCTAGECTCYSGNKQCYRKCARDLDCGTGQTCDTKKSHLCQGNSACETDTQCAVRTGNLASKCNAGKCALSCATDRDCSGTGLNGAFTGMVCGSDNFCVSVATDCAEEGALCPAAVGALKRFCVATPAAPGTVVSSSITD